VNEKEFLEERAEIAALRALRLPPPEGRACDVCGAPAVSTLGHPSAGHTFRCEDHIRADTGSESDIAEIQAVKAEQGFNAEDDAEEEEDDGWDEADRRYKRRPAPYLHRPL